MSVISLEPYLFFNGNCKEAMEFYKKVFGGELEMTKMGDAPKDSQMPGADPESIMHSSLKGPVKLMASDSPKASDKTAKIELSLGGTDEAKMKKIFDALSEGGEVRMELKKQFWGDTFGMLSDKFGVDWMMNVGDNMT